MSPSQQPHAIAGLRNLIAELFPGAEVVRARPLRADEAGEVEAGGGGDTAKAGGYGRPVEIVLRQPGAGERHLVWHTASANQYGHDRRSDRAQELLLAFDTFGRIPRHVQALDVGAILPGNRLVSLRDAGELYLLTEYASGRPYAADLRRVAAAGAATPLDLERAAALAAYLVDLHRVHPTQAAGPVYRRAVRDLVGHGEGIFGLVDGYGPDVPSAPPERLHRIEQRVLEWRWRLRGRCERLRRIHGDFHPFNILFPEDGTDLAVLDAARGSLGDPADDVTCLALNYVFFALEVPGAWDGLGPLWHRLWRDYLRGSLDRDLLAVAPPYLAWRALVMASPGFYPGLSAAARDRLLGLVEEALVSDSFDPASAEALFR